MINKIGFMQGRLVPSEKKNRIQYFPEKNWKKEILLAKKNNYKIMEWTVNIENINKNPIFQANKIDNLKIYLGKYNIKVASVTCDFFMQRPFFKNKKNRYILEYLEKLIINGQKIGIKYFIIPLVDQSSIKNKTQENLLIRGIKNFERLLGKKSKILFEIDYKPLSVARFIKKLKSSKYGINYDTGNSAGLGFSFSNEKKYFKFVKNIHLKDKELNGKTIRLGNGNFKFRSFFSYLKKVNYKGNLILQTARAKNKSHEYELNLNREYIQKYL